MRQVRRVVFVCLGNICRSPTAEGVLRARLEARGLGSQVEVDSAGTSGYHAGELPDARMRTHAARRGYTLDSRARQFVAQDLERFDLVVAMDRENRRDILRLARTSAQAERVRLFCDFVAEADTADVPDPYYGGAEGFERVLDLIEAGCDPLIDHLLSAGTTR